VSRLELKAKFFLANPNRLILGHKEIVPHKPCDQNRPSRNLCNGGEIRNDIEQRTLKDRGLLMVRNNYVKSLS